MIVNLIAMFANFIHTILLSCSRSMINKQRIFIALNHRSTVEIFLIFLIGPKINSCRSLLSNLKFMLILILATWQLIGATFCKIAC